MVDVHVRSGPVDELDAASRSPAGNSFTTDAAVLHSAVGDQRYGVFAGREVVVDPASGTVDEEDLQFMLGGPIAGVLLHQRGHLVLHAGVVSLDERAVGFLGDSGAGKSTTCVWMARAGWDLVSDEVLAFSTESGTLRALPGLPWARLTPDTPDRLRLDEGALVRTRADDPDAKVTFPAPVPPTRSEVIVRALVVLRRTSGFTVTSVPPARAAVELVRHTYTVHALQASGREGHLDRCGEVASTVPVVEVGLATVDDLARLEALMRSGELFVTPAESPA